MGEIRRPVGHPPKAGAFGRSPGSRGNPWALFGYFLSQQKVTPRRGGETRQRAFRTRQECEGADWRVAVKRKRDYHKRKHCTQNREADTFKKRPCGPVLKGRQTKPLAPGAPRGWVSANLVPAAACHFEDTKIQREAARAFLGAIVLAAAYIERCCLIPGSFARYGGQPGAVRPGPGPDCVR